ncbi:MAG TPA: pirin family protein [Paraburkholderia sp.]|jgi:redox-sensitive bicupin YhaK (pirin superfamily)|nr:pirin family protein [Paraburkholderia sp.]
MGALRKPHHALAAQPARRISLRTKGRANGQLTRLVSPSDIGQAIKPFVLLDRFVVEAHKPLNVPMHPHSGIAVLTTLLDGSLQIIDTRGMPATLLPGATDWIRTGRGTWHGGPGIATGEVRGYQLWISLPPALELSEPYEQIFAPDRIPVEGPARVLLGAYNGTQSPLAPPAPMTCLHVELDAGEGWCYDPPPEHDVLWIAVYTGSLDAGEPVEAGELIVFEHDARSVEFFAHTNCGFMLGSAQRSPFDVVEGYFSVHTNPAALRFGEVEIARLAFQLRAEGRLDAEQSANVARKIRFGA